jgi:hypothetical protein
MATVGCGISHKDTKHAVKRSNNRTTQEKYDETTDKYFLKYCEDNTKVFDIKYTYIIPGITNSRENFFTYYE